MSEYTTVGDLPVWHRTKQMLTEVRRIAVELRDHAAEVKAGLERIRDEEAGGQAPQTPVKGRAEPAPGTRPAESKEARQGPCTAKDLDPRS